MDQRSSGVLNLQSVPGSARFRLTGGASTWDDPIGEVDAAVRTVLATQVLLERPDRAHDVDVFVERLFSVRHAEAVRPGTRVLRLATSTVITPLARDCLKQRGIEIRLGNLGDSFTAPQGEWAFAIETEMGKTMSLRRALLEDPRPWIELDHSLESVTYWTIQETIRGAMFVTEEGALSVWKACGVQGVRAATADEPSQVLRATRSLGINVLVVEPAAKSIAWLRQLATTFRLAGAPRVPGALMKEA
jgi:hypothetical protein